MIVVRLVTRGANHAKRQVLLSICRAQGINVDITTHDYSKREGSLSKAAAVLTLLCPPHTRIIYRA